MEEQKVTLTCTVCKRVINLEEGVVELTLKGIGKGTSYTLCSLLCVAEVAKVIEKSAIELLLEHAMSEVFHLSKDIRVVHPPAEPPRDTEA